MSCFFVNGKGLRKYCLENNIPYNRVYYYLDKGFSIDESLKKVNGVPRYPQTKFRINGETVHQYCRNNNIIYNSVVRDIKKGLSAEEAVRKAILLKGKRGRPHKGFIF